MVRAFIIFILFTIQATHADDCNYLPSPPDAGRVLGVMNVAQAWYAGPTTRYGHAVLGDSIEAETLYVLPKNSGKCALSVTLNTHSVFEDVTPLVADITGDGDENVIAIESHQDKGASLAVYGIKKNTLKKVASTPYIGTRFRWLAPIGSADFNGDGVADIAYVETPHLAGVIKLWSFANKHPRLLASTPGFSNHRIGENYVTGGITTCGGSPAIILPNREWSQTFRIKLIDGKLKSSLAANDTHSNTINDLLRCN